MAVCHLAGMFELIQLKLCGVLLFVVFFLQLLGKHKNMESMVELLQLYQMEDEAYNSLAEATTELYQYLLQPFRDMTELAMLRRQQIKVW